MQKVKRKPLATKYHTMQNPNYGKKMNIEFQYGPNTKNSFGAKTKINFGAKTEKIQQQQNNKWK